MELDWDHFWASYPVIWFPFMPVVDSVFEVINSEKISEVIEGQRTCQLKYHLSPHAAENNMGGNCSLQGVSQSELHKNIA